MEFVAKFGELWGNPRKYKSPTLAGRKFALLEGLIHDLKSVPDRFIMSILRGRCGTVNYHPVLYKINKLKSFSGVEIDQKGFAVQESRSITFVRPVRYGTGVALTLRCSCGSIQLSVNATP